MAPIQFIYCILYTQLHRDTNRNSSHFHSNLSKASLCAFNSSPCSFLLNLFLVSLVFRADGLKPTTTVMTEFAELGMTFTYSSLKRLFPPTYWSHEGHSQIISKKQLICKGKGDKEKLGSIYTKRRRTTYYSRVVYLVLAEYNQERYVPMREGNQCLILSGTSGGEINSALCHTHFTC